MVRQCMKAILALAAPLVLGATGPGHGHQSSEPPFPDNTVFYVDDIQVTNAAGYPLFIRIALTPQPPGSGPAAHTYFTIDKAELQTGMAQIWLAMFNARERDCTLGVEPKTGNNKPDADGTVTHPYNLVSLSFGALAKSLCTRQIVDTHLGLYFGQTPPEVATAP